MADIPGKNLKDNGLAKVLSTVLNRGLSLFLLCWR